MQKLSLKLPIRGAAGLVMQLFVSAAWSSLSLSETGNEWKDFSSFMHIRFEEILIGPFRLFIVKMAKYSVYNYWQHKFRGDCNPASGTQCAVFKLHISLV